MENKYNVNNSKECYNNCTENIENNNLVRYAITSQNTTFIITNPKYQNNKWLQEEGKNKDNIIQK